MSATEKLSSVERREMIEALDATDAFRREVIQRHTFIAAATNHIKFAFIGERDGLPGVGALVATINGKPFFGDINLDAVAELNAGMGGEHVKSRLADICRELIAEAILQAVPDSVIGEVLMALGQRVDGGGR